MATGRAVAHSIVPVIGSTLKNATSQAWVVLDVRTLSPDGAICAVELMREDDFHAGARQEPITLTAAQFQDFCQRHRILLPRA